MRAYQSKVLGLCLSFLSNATQAEDAAQEVFIKAYQSLGSFQGNSSFSTWLYRITANHCKDLLRQKMRQKTESLEAMMEESGDAIEHLLKTSSAQGVSAEASELIEKILSLLSTDERAILILREAEGLSYEEIAGSLGCTVEAVRSRLRRARESLDEKLRHFTKASRV